MTRMERFGGSAFALTNAVIAVLAHAVAYLTHEFSHSICAWALGFMANPLALDYGEATPANLVLLSSVGDNVQYEPILQGGHGFAAALIALAGPYLGNALLYVCLHALTKRAAMHPLALAFTFWLLAMCVGNVWSYVPIRALTTHADIAIAARGLDIGVLAMFPFLMVLSLLLVGHFLARACPRFISAMACGDNARTAVLVAMTATWVFFFYGMIGVVANYGAMAQAFSLASMLLLMPWSVAWLWQRCSVAGG
ncbi:hypothetical protein IP91_01867 [Pseudoduganella lurida]|uniref:M50 family peptidase n=1 Tax=Pseudoduganella lurida TaxID=1036180 RepID=A0A562RFH3_9BURK|nr:hypothetical protein [Pseudoduganella lurida]TWI67748.1 hypothetical protein IP91_01867 [Pseudoduganella lurida]